LVFSYFLFPGLTNARETICTTAAATSASATAR